MPDEPFRDPPEPAPETLLATTPDRRRAEGWVLVLLSLAMHPNLQRVPGGFALFVRLSEAARARAELAATEAEEAEAWRATIADQALAAPPATRHAWAGSVAMMAALVAFHAVTGPSRAEGAWFDAGASDASLVLHGEWWRAITALTLHADPAHVLSNAGLGAIVVGAVMRAMGVGWGAALVLAAGVAGNFANAWLYQAHHASIGFSTAVFGAIGILGGLASMRARRHAHGSRAAWTGLGAALALLGMLGASAETDVLAHFFGGVAGFALGLAAGWRAWRPASTAGQALAGLAVLGVVVGAWLVAGV